MLNIKALLTKILDCDIVIETGITNGWTWRKWKSGRAEIWTNHKPNIAINTSAPAYGGYRSLQVTMPTFPFNFKSGTTPFAIAMMASGMSQGAWVNHVEVSNTGGSYYLSAGASLPAAERNVSIIINGFWK